MLALTINSALGFWYSSNMLFNVMKPTDHSGPLHGSAVQFAEQHPSVMAARRAYALEAWLNGPMAAIGSAILPFMIYSTLLQCWS